MSINYLFGALIPIPLLPIVYYQGKKIRAGVPKLPDTKRSKGQTNFEERLNKNRIQVIPIRESNIADLGVETHLVRIIGSFSNRLSRLFRRSVSWKVYAKSGYTAQLVTNINLSNNYRNSCQLDNYRLRRQ